MQNNLNVQDDNQSVRDSATSTNSVDNTVIELEKIGEDKKALCLEDDMEEITQALDIVYEKSSCDVRTGIKSPSSFSTLKSDSMSEFERMVTQVKKPKKRLIVVIRISHIILIVYAIILFVISFYLSRQTITQLVGQSIPQVTAGFGVLTFLIFLLGLMANRRAWICGFNVQVLCLVVLLLSEALVICACVFQKYEIFFNSDIYWKHLSDAGKARVMSNWQCCGWIGTCDISDPSSLYFQFRHFEGSACLAATESETTKWTMDVAIIFGSFVLFDILYMIYTITCQSKRLKRQRHKIVKNAADEKRKKAMRKRKSSFARFRSMSISQRFRPSHVVRRISHASISPRFRSRSFGRNTSNVDLMSSETNVTRDNDG